MSAKISDSVKSGVDERKYLASGGLNWIHLGKLSVQQLQTQSPLKNTGSQQQGGQKKSLLTLDSDDEEESSDGTSALTQAQLSLMAKDLAPDWDSALVKQQLARNALKSSPGLVTNSILFCSLFKIKNWCQKVRFQQTHNQGLRQLLLTVSWDLLG